MSKDIPTCSEDGHLSDTYESFSFLWFLKET